MQYSAAWNVVCWSFGTTCRSRLQRSPLEDGTDSFSGKIGTEFPHCVVQYSRRENKFLAKLMSCEERICRSTFLPETLGMNVRLRLIWFLWFTGWMCYSLLRHGTGCILPVHPLTTSSFQNILILLWTRYYLPSLLWTRYYLPSLLWTRYYLPSLLWTRYYLPSLLWTRYYLPSLLWTRYYLPSLLWTRYYLPILCGHATTCPVFCGHATTCPVFCGHATTCPVFCGHATTCPVFCGYATTCPTRLAVYTTQPRSEISPCDLSQLTVKRA